MRKWLLSAAAVLCLATAGCGTSARRDAAPPPAGDAAMRSQQTHADDGKKLDSAQAAKRLEELAARVEGVEKAHAVVAGTTAVVGIDVGGSVERSKVGTIKYAVAQALREDPLGVNAVVTADMDVSRRLAELGEDIRAGRPIQGFAEEMADLIGRVMPQLPSEVMPLPESNVKEPAASPARP
ncbi:MULTISPECIES: YhcN/YlaJ family sporulation lipoprotein [Paenibacillus]|nr:MULTISPECIES: YhcN/YlaJ family sporulation lipoprotein [Paenibacillus]QGG56914.1 YhcN/YlaJ family sporulation lipoprotein [Paenibacillus sp. B01]